MSDSSEERTEQATDKRMREVRRDGKLSRSQDLSAWIGIGAVGAMLPTVVQNAADGGTDQLLNVPRIIAQPDPRVALEMLGEGLGTVLGLIAPVLAVVAVIAVAAAFVQGGIHLKQMKGRFDQFNLVNGVKRTFGGQALWEGVKALLKTAVVGGVLAIVVSGLLPTLASSASLPLSAVMDVASGGVVALLQAGVLAGLALAVFDMLVIARRNRKHTRMTKKEVRDESKNSEGDPLIKSQRRARQLAMSRNRMIAAVADADVVVVNPTHYAVALRYEAGRSAPRVIAKGVDEIARRIREKAEESGVPLVREVALARGLHAACDVGQEIPAELYTAVARLLAFVMALQRRGGASGIQTMAPVLTGGES